MIELKHITKVFNQGAPNEFTGIHDVSLTLDKNKITCFQGPSGSGKTTLLSMIGCLSKPSQGRITMNQKTLSGLPERFLAKVRQTVFGFVFQEFNLIRGLSVIENIMLPAYPMGTPYKQVRSRALSLLDQFDLSPKKKMNVQTLSGGEAQRVAVCRALINDPEVIIADEPTANLDAALSLELLELLQDLIPSGKTVIISSHDPIIFESPAVDQVVNIRYGRIVSPDGYAA